MMGYVLAYGVDRLTDPNPTLCHTQAEKLNGRAAMMGYVLAYGVDRLTGAGIADQQDSFLGKLALHAVVFAILIFRTSATIPIYKNLLDEATFYDRQWAATWEGQPRPSETEKA